MSIALITTTPFAILEVFPADYANVNIAGTWQAQNVGVGYTTPDGLYKLVAVVPFVPPEGLMTIGQPTYAISAEGIVTQTFATQAIPAQHFVSFQTIISRLTDLEYTGVKKAIAAQVQANNATVPRWYDLAQGKLTIDLNDSMTITIKGLLVSSGLLTQARADAVFAV
jgi:hypothetical protein